MYIIDVDDLFHISNLTSTRGQGEMLDHVPITFSP